MAQPPPATSPEPAADRARAKALQVAAIYGLFASLWILLSDPLVALWIGDPTLVQVVSMLKGWGFVGTTSVLLYFLVRRQLTTDSRATDAAGGAGTGWLARHRWPRFSGRRAFVQRLAGITIKNDAETPQRLRALAATGDAQALAFVAHGLKGVAGNLMAQSVYDLALATERAAREESPDQARLAHDLAAATERLLAELVEWSGLNDSPS